MVFLILEGVVLDARREDTKVEQGLEYVVHPESGQIVLGQQRVMSKTVMQLVVLLQVLRWVRRSLVLVHDSV